MSLTGSCFSSESAPRALPSWDSKTRRNNLLGGLAVNRTAGTKRTYELTSSIVPRGTSFHRSVDLRLPPGALILGALHAAAVSLVQWNSVPSIQMRCRITANLQPYSPQNGNIRKEDWRLSPISPAELARLSGQTCRTPNCVAGAGGIEPPNG